MPVLTKSSFKGAKGLLPRPEVSNGANEIEVVPMEEELHDDENVSSLADIENRVVSQIDSLNEAIERTEREMGNIKIEEIELKKELQEVRAIHVQFLLSLACIASYGLSNLTTPRGKRPIYYII